MKLRADSQNSESKRSQQLNLFGPALLLEGEDEGAYDEFVARLFAALKPVDVVDEMFLSDIAILQWEISRLRRLKFSLIRDVSRKELREFLQNELEIDECKPELEAELVEALTEIQDEDGKQDYPQKMARRYVRDDPEAVEDVQTRLEDAGQDINDVLKAAVTNKMEELTAAFARREPDALEEVRKHLAAQGLTIDDLVGVEFRTVIGELQGIDHLIATAEDRRDTSLHEIERRHALFGEALRRKVQQIEADDLKVIEGTSSKGKTAA